MFLLSALIWEYWIELVVVELPCIVFTFPTNLLSISSFVTGALMVFGLTPCPCMRLHFLLDQSVINWSVELIGRIVFLCYVIFLFIVVSTAIYIYILIDLIFTARKTFQLIRTCLLMESTNYKSKRRSQACHTCTYFILKSVMASLFPMLTIKRLHEVSCITMFELQGHLPIGIKIKNISAELILSTEAIISNKLSLKWYRTCDNMSWICIRNIHVNYSPLQDAIDAIFHPAGKLTNSYFNIGNNGEITDSKLWPTHQIPPKAC